MRPLLLLLMVLGGLTTTTMASELPVDRVELLDLLRNGDFEALEARLTRLQEDSEAGNGQDQWVGVAFHTFSLDDREILAKIEDWVSQMPKSYAALVARAIQYRNLGWEARGGAYAKETSEEQFAGMREYFSKARNDLYAALGLNNKLSIAYAYLVSLANAEGRDRQTLIAAETGLHIAPKSYHVRWMFLTSLQPKWGGSMEVMERFVAASISQFPDDSLLQSLGGYPDWIRGNRLWRQRKYDEALELYDRALEHGPHWRYLKARAVALDRLGRDEEALEAYDQANALRPQETEILESRGWLRFTMGRLVEALEDYTLALDLDPLDPGNLTSRAMVLRDLKQNDLALADLDKALIRGSDNARVRGTRGQLLLHQFQDPEAARSDLERATELAPEDINHWYFYGGALYALKDCEFVPAFRKYEALCDAPGECYEESLSWVRNTLKFVNDQGFCPK